MSSKKINDIPTETRTVSRFLFLPKTIAGKTKWMQNATWKEERMFVEQRSTIFNPFAIGSFYWTDWKPTKFI